MDRIAEIPKRCPASDNLGGDCRVKLGLFIQNMTLPLMLANSSPIQPEPPHLIQIQRPWELTPVQVQLCQGSGVILLGNWNQCHQLHFKVLEEVYQWSAKVH